MRNKLICTLCMGAVLSLCTVNVSVHADEIVNNSNYEEIVSSNVEESNQADNGYEEVVWGEDEDLTWEDFWGYKECTINDLDFRLTKGNTCEVLKNGRTTSISGELQLPDKIKVEGEYYIVNSIRNYTFKYADHLTSIVIPKSITSIGEEAFSQCTSLVNVDFKGEVKKIGYKAFEKCTSLTEFKIPEGIETLQPNTFLDCTSLVRVSIPKTLKEINDSLFVNCNNLQDIKIDEDNPNFMFEDNIIYNKDKTDLILYLGNDSKTEFKVPEGVKKVSGGRFDNIEKVIVPDSVEEIGGFKEYENLKEVVLGNGIKKISPKAFSQCYGLENIVLPESVVEIGRSAFESCINLKSINIPKGVTTISNSAFAGCTKMKRMDIPNNIKYIDKQAFKFCWSLEELIIPDSVEEIGYEAFYGCYKLKGITIPNGIKSLDSYVFSQYAVIHNLQSLVIPDTLEEVKDSSFFRAQFDSVWSSNEQYDKFKYKINSDAVFIESNLHNIDAYNNEVFKIKADSVKCVERLSDGSEIETDLACDENGYFVHTPQGEAGESKIYYYKAVKDDVEYPSPVIRVIF